MNKTKAVVNFRAYSAAEFGPVARNIHDRMSANAATFPAPPIDMATLLALVDDYDAKLIARASGRTTDVLALQVARAALAQVLSALGGYVNGVAKGDPAIVEQSGFPSYVISRTPDTAPPPAPANLRLRQGKLSGSITARYKPNRQWSVNEVQCNITGDPDTEASWQTKGMFKGGRAELDGFTPGTLVWVRVRTVGLKSVMGSWSDPAQIRVV